MATRIDVFGVPTTAQTFQSSISDMLGYLTSGDAHYISTCTVATLIQAKDDEIIHNALENADLVCADGMPIVWMQKHLGYADAERVYGPDILNALCEATAEQDIGHYFYGGLGNVPQLMIQKLEERYPQLTIIGADAPPMIDMKNEPKAETIQYLNSLKADIIWIGLGSPKQDLWMATYQPHLNAKLLIGVGAAFDFIAGVKPQAPRWMQRNGLEWLYRFVTEPRRLWRRYLVYNTRFIWHVLKGY